MKTLLRRGLSTALLLLCLPLCALADDFAKAEAAAVKWLSLVDKGAYAQSHKEAAAYFRQAVSPAQLTESLNAVRKPLGDLVSRALLTRTKAGTLPGAPDGNYVVMTFDTVMKRKKSAVETVTACEDPDGLWRVVGYYIR